MAPAELIITGLKAIDLLSPVTAGEEVLISGEEKAGARILGMELAFRLAQLPWGPCHTMILLDAAIPDLDGVLADFKGSLPEQMTMNTCESVETKQLTNFVQKSPRTPAAVFAFSKNLTFLHSFRDAVSAAKQEGSPVTAFFVTEEISIGGFRTKILCARALAVEGNYPAYDPRESSSQAFSESLLTARHQEVATLVRTRVEELVGRLHPGATKDPQWEYNSDPSRTPALQLFRFLSQPFFCAEQFTGMKGSFIPLADTIEAFSAIAEGKYAKEPVRSFYMKNRLEGLSS